MLILAKTGQRSKDYEKHMIYRTCQYPDMYTLWIMQARGLTDTNIQGVRTWALGEQENFQLTAHYRT